MMVAARQGPVGKGSKGMAGQRRTEARRPAAAAAAVTAAAAAVTTARPKEILIRLARVSVQTTSEKECGYVKEWEMYELDGVNK